MPEKRKRPTSSAALTERSAAYYSVMHDEDGERFEAALHALFEAIYPEFTEPLTAQQRLDAIRRSDLCTTEDDHKLADALVEAFVREWRLPRTRVSDVWASFYRAQYGEPLRLMALLSPGSSSRLTKKRIKLAPFFYAPSLDPAAAVDQYVKDTRLVERVQAERVKLARRGLLPAPLRHRAHTIAMARRLYLRARLGWSYETIAKADGASVHAVQVSVTDWADALGVPLPATR